MEMPDKTDASKTINTTDYEVYIKFYDLKKEKDADPKDLKYQTDLHMFICENQDCAEMEDLHEVKYPFKVKDPTQKAIYGDKTQVYVLYSGNLETAKYKLEFAY